LEIETSDSERGNNKQKNLPVSSKEKEKGKIKKKKGKQLPFSDNEWIQAIAPPFQWFACF
jgi:hypothetical protein